MSSAVGHLSPEQIKQGRRHLVTPEGIDLQIELADVGSRIGAFAIDLTIIVLTLIAAAYGLSSMSLYNGELAFTIFVLIAFLLRSFYFTLPETEALFSKFVFTPAQIDAYGIKELHVLEDVLRAQDRDVLTDVANRIRTKIGWVWESGESDILFLRAYYAALRGRLESKMLMGVRRKDKFDTR